MYKLIRWNVNNSESAFSGANLSWPFGSAVLINKPGLSLVRKARLAHRNTAFRSVSLCQRGGRRLVGTESWVSPFGMQGEHPLTSGETAPGPSSSLGAEEKQTNAQSRRSEKTVVQPKAAW